PADGEEAPGNTELQMQGAGGIDDLGFIHLEAFQARRRGTGGDDEMLRFNALAVDLDRMRIQKARAAVAQRDTAATQQTGDAAGEALDNAVTPRSQAAEVDLRPAEAQAELGGAAGMVDLSGGVQQSLGGNAADV